MKTKAFTIIEIVLVMSLLAIVTGILGPQIFSGINSFNLVKTRSRMLQQARSGLDRMVAEIRLVPSSNDIHTLNISSFSFDYPSGTTITYTLSGTKLLRNSVELIDDVSALTFSYYDEDGGVTSTAADLKRLSINLTIDPPGDVPAYTLQSQVHLRNTGNNYTARYKLD